MNTKVFLGNLPWYKPGFYGVRAGSRWPHFETEVNQYMPFPFQLAYAAACLEQERFPVSLVDGIAGKMSIDDFLSRILQIGPDLVVLEVSTPSINTDLSFVKHLRRAIGGDTKIALCGPHAPMLQTEFLEVHEDVDLVMIGEYEKTLLSVSHAIEDGHDLESIPGLIFRDDRCRLKNTGPPEVFEDIDSLPWPARHLLPMMRYVDNPGSIPDPTLQMWGSRGCPYKCTYCVWPHVMKSTKYRPRNVVSILDEMEHVCHEYGFRSVYFDDDTFNIGRQRMLDFCCEKIQRNNHIPWAIMARADLMDQEILEAMAKAGLKAVKYGIESADPKLLTHVHKNLDVQKAIENIRKTKALDIKVHLTFMFGIPGETKQSIQRTIQLANQLRPDSVQFSILTPFPGTPIYDELKARGHLLDCDDWRRLDGYFRSMVRTDELSPADLERAVRRAWRSWMLHKHFKLPEKKDVRHLIQRIPGHLLNPVGSINQIRRIFNV